MSNWTQPQCERCWIERNAEWKLEFRAEGEAGIVGYQRLVGVKMPVRLTEPVVEQCAWCGEPTIFGMYVREDPTKVSFPAADDEQPTG